MLELKELYQELILDHSKHPRNFGELKCANRCAEGHNPLCGDQLTVFLHVEDNIVKDAHFEGKGCAISTASASLMTDVVKNRPVEEAKQLFEQFHQMVTQGNANDNTGNGELDKLQALAGVREFPIRVKCATLPWHTLEAALDNTHEKVTTE